MDKYIRDLVMTVAIDVRYWAEKKANDIDGWISVENLSGMCAIASAELHRKLKDVGVDSEICLSLSDNEGHVFCVVDDHIVDVTATQFREFRDKEVVLLHTKAAEVYYYYSPTEFFADAASLRKYQKKTGWPTEQIAFAK